MDKIEKFFKPLFLLAAVVWIALAATHTLNNNQLFVYLGCLSILIGLRNILILNVSYRTNQFHEKIQNYIERYGFRQGIIRYAIFMVLIYLIFGLGLIIIFI